MMSIPKETNIAQKAPRRQSHACSPPSGNDEGSIKLGGAGAAGPASASASFSISAFGAVVSCILCSKLEAVSGVWLCFSVSIGDVFKVVSEPLVLPRLCGVVIARAAVALEVLICWSVNARRIPSSPSL
jgi:hypothetical protein